MSLPDFPGSGAEPVSNLAPDAALPGTNPGRPLVRWFYSQNPFYAISAALVFTGLRMTFDTGGRGVHVAGLLGSLAAYALLLAGTAWMLIRLGQAWDDVRSLLLLVALMFVAIAVSLDEALAADPVRGAAYCLTGWLLAAAMSQALLFGLGIRLRTAYLVPYHVALAHLFLYPLTIVPLLEAPAGEAVQWRLYGFSLLSGLLALLLLPAVRRGQDYVANNGTPWHWPLFPWSLFFVMAVGLGLRGYFLCLSLHVVTKGSIFGLHFLVPLAAGATLLLLERAIATGSVALRRWTLAMPALWALLAGTAHRHELVYENFLAAFREVCHATPLYATLWLAAAFYALAAFRRVRGALDWLTLCFMAMAWFHPGSWSLTEPSALQAWPLCLAALVQMTIAGWNREPFRLLLAGALAVIALHAAMLGTPWGLYRWHTTAHAALAMALVGGLAFKGDFGEALRQWGAAGLVIFSLVALWWHFPAAMTPWLRSAYPGAMLALALAMHWLTRDQWFQVAARVIAAAWALATGGRLYWQWRTLSPGLDYIVAGLGFFAAAAAISLNKLGRSPWQSVQKEAGQAARVRE